MRAAADLLALLARCRTLQPDKETGRAVRCDRIATWTATVYQPARGPERETVLCRGHALEHLPMAFDAVLDRAPLRLAVYRRFGWAPEWSHVDFAGVQLGIAVDLAKSGLMTVDGTWYPEEPFSEPHSWAARLTYPATQAAGAAGAKIPGSLGRFASREAAVTAIVAMYPPLAEHLAELEKTGGRPQPRTRKAVRHGAA